VTDIFGNTIIHAAVLSENIPVLRSVIATDVNIDSQNESGITPLGLAASHQLLAQVKILLKNEATISIKDIEGENVLTLAVRADEMRGNRQKQEARAIESLGEVKVAEKVLEVTLQDLRKTEEVVSALLSGDSTDQILVNSVDSELRPPL